MEKQQGSFLPRVLTGLIAAAALLALIWMPGFGWLLMLVAAVLVGVGLHEFYTMCELKHLTPESPLGMAAGAIIVLSGAWGSVLFTNFVFAVAVMLIVWAHMAQRNWSMPAIGATVFGVIYLGWFGAHFVLLYRFGHEGPGLVTLLAVAVCCSDAGAYIAGKLLGRHKLAARVSPNKTWEGSAGGVITAMFGAVVLHALCRRYGWTAYPGWPALGYAAVAAVLAVVEQIGDLVESMIKRDAGVKDSGAFFPGHGGALDRCDGFLFATPVLYYLVAFFPN
jgi:phosphatidate cytidylyltransferase